MSTQSCLLLSEPIFAKIQETTGAREYTDLNGDEDKDGVDMAYRCAVDLRCDSLNFVVSEWSRIIFGLCVSQLQTEHGQEGMAEITSCEEFSDAL